MKIKKHWSKIKKWLKSHHLKNLALITFSILIIGAGSGVIWLSTMEIPDLHAFETRKIIQSTKIYDRTGEIILYDIHEGAKRTVVPLSEISDYIKNSTIAIEDTEFYNHFGIRPKAILRAAFAVLVTRNYSQGGSTITQQVVKNAILTTDKTITRKLKEWVIAIKLERVLSKDQILEAYLNETPYGGNVYGVQEASKMFFGKGAKDVTLAQGAFISAVAQAPTYYSPYGSHKDALIQRQRLVLKRMLENELITETEYENALNEEVIFLSRSESGIKAPHFSLMVREYLVEKYGEDFVEQGGLKVTTTLDYNLQRMAEDVVENYSKDLRERFDEKMNTSIVAIDPKTGDVLTMVGSRDYFDKEIDGNYNIATAKRQPGSAFKPIVYATAFNKGYTPETILFDVKTEFSSSCDPKSEPKNIDAVCYSPGEYDDLLPGPMTMKRALAQSRNIPAVKTLYLAGINDSLKLASDLGITGLNDPARYGLTLVLGGGEVKLLDLTSAYGVFANDGIRNPTRFILKIENNKGEIVEETELSPNQVLQANTARQISDILSDKKERIQSIQQLLKSSDKDIAVKTGTTNDYRDVWTIGYTPQISVGVWAGHNDNTPIDKSKTAGLVITPLWSAFMLEAIKDMPKERFIDPDPTPLDLKPNMRGHWNGGESIYIDTISGKLATEYTPIEFKQENVINSVHSILYWVDKSNPRGPVPQNPENDSQFENWEYGVREWLKSYQKSNPSFVEGVKINIPTEEDDVHGPEFAPVVSIISPANNKTYKSDEKITTNLSIFSKENRKTLRVEYFINDRYIGKITENPFQISFIPEDTNGIEKNNTLKVVVYDEILNKSEVTTKFRVDL
jgi:1A family penicillin-binding protein